MHVLFRKIFQKFCKSTAQSTVIKLKNNNISSDDINDQHILYVYEGMNKLADSPDFSSIVDILPDFTTKEINKSDVFSIIVETRKHPALEYVVRNLNKNTNIPIQIFHGRKNLDFIMSTSIADEVENGNVILTQLNTDELTASQYNALFLTKKFWECVRGRNKILVFQTDSIICSFSDFSLADFISFDYIGSKFPRYRPVGLIIDGGNGGFSLRDWTKIYQCLERFDPNYWTGGEDGYFAFHVELMGGKVGKGHECAKFSTQHNFLFKSWGAHRISCLNKKEKNAFLNYCGEAKFMREKPGKK